MKIPSRSKASHHKDSKGRVFTLIPSNDRYGNDYTVVSRSGNMIGKLEYDEAIGREGEGWMFFPVRNGKISSMTSFFGRRSLRSALDLL